MENIINFENKVLKLKETTRERIKKIIECERGDFDDGGSTGWLKGQAISIVIIIILLGLITAFVPQFWTKISSYFLNLF